MLKKERDILREISEKLSDNERVLKIIAYGSRVRGDYRGDSDLDILVVVDKKDKALKDKILGIFYSYELETDIPFSATILSLEELEFNLLKNWNLMKGLVARLLRVSKRRE